MRKISIMTIFGTRPEAVKMAPVIKAIERDPRFESIVTITAQHREMLDQVLEVFEISPDFDLDIMKDGQTLSEITARVLNELSTVFLKCKPDILLVHGDTATTFAASVASFFHKIKIGHVEAGLRTWNKFSPFPEEMNRQLTDVLADIYFAPTSVSKNNLLKENRNEDSIYITGNTAIDAMKYTIKDNYENELLSKINNKMILITTHRRENIGQPMENIFRAVNRLLKKHKDIEFVFPIHKNPKVRELAKNVLISSNRIHLIEPLDVIDFQNIAKHSYFIMSDSGGVQEEASFLGKPVIVLRDTTERPEGVEAGTLKLAGVQEEKIFQIADELLSNRDEYDKMSKAINPYGDGMASERILEAIAYNFDFMDNRPSEFEVKF